MATKISEETVNIVKESLQKHGFENAMRRASVDAIAAGMDADDFTYQLVALFTHHILHSSMRSYNDFEKKFVTLRGNAAAMIQVVQSVSLQLAQQIDAEAKIAKKVDAEPETKH